MQDSEAAGEQTFAEFKRQRRAEQDDVEFPDEVPLHVHCICILLSLDVLSPAVEAPPWPVYSGHLIGCSVSRSGGTTMASLLWTFQFKLCCL